jgi:hypothetical protein
MFNFNDFSITNFILGVFGVFENLLVNSGKILVIEIIACEALIIII